MENRLPQHNNVGKTKPNNNSLLYIMSQMIDLPPLAGRTCHMFLSQLHHMLLARRLMQRKLDMDIRSALQGNVKMKDELQLSPLLT
jgi:hypothetical protein